VHDEGPTIRTRHGKTKKGRKGKKKKGKDGVDSGPHASFQTRSGNMNLQLGTTLITNTSGNGERGERANIFVGTRKGNIEVTLVSSAMHHAISGRWIALLVGFDDPLRLSADSSVARFISFEFWAGKKYISTTITGWKM
jgi:hypothetical protein